MKDRLECKLNAEEYIKIILLAREQPFEFSQDVREFLVKHAVSVNNHDTYHFGNSSVWYRTDIPPEQEDSGLVNIALNITGETKIGVEYDAFKIIQVFPQFKSFLGSPDPLMLNPELYEKVSKAPKVF